MCGGLCGLKHVVSAYVSSGLKGINQVNAQVKGGQDAIQRTAMQTPLYYYVLLLLDIYYYLPFFKFVCFFYID